MDAILPLHSKNRTTREDLGTYRGSGSGKSTILNGLREYFGERAAVLSLDNYYRPKSELPVDENGETNFDLPEVINDADLVRDIDHLRAGRPIELDTYTYNRDVMQSEKSPSPLRNGWWSKGCLPWRTQRWKSASICSASSTPQLRFGCRANRTGWFERGYTEDEVRYQWRNHVRPADIAHIEPWKDKAHVVVDNTEHWQAGLELLIAKMEEA